MSKYRTIELTDAEIAEIRVALHGRLRDLNADDNQFARVEDSAAREVLQGHVRACRWAAGSAYVALDKGVYGQARE